MTCLRKYVDSSAITLLRRADRARLRMADPDLVPAVDFWQIVDELPEPWDLLGLADHPLLLSPRDEGLHGRRRQARFRLIRVRDAQIAHVVAEPLGLVLEELTNDFMVAAHVSSLCQMASSAGVMA